MKRILLSLLSLAAIAQAAPVDVTTRTLVTSANAKSTLDRATNRITSTVEVTLKNTGDRPLGEPLQAAIDFTAQSGALTGLLVPGAQGGVGLPPHNTFFFDLSAANPGDSLAAGASVTFTLRFTPAAGTRVTYAVRTFAELNNDPAVNAGGPYAGVVGQPVAFSSTGTTDPDGDVLTFEWNFADGSAPSTEAAPQHTFATAGFYEAQLTVQDARGASRTVRVPVTISPAAVFALARTRTLDGNGQPLAAVSVNETKGAQIRNLLSGATGFTPLGVAPGSYVWEFSKPGHLTVFREGTLAQGATVIANPWLTKLNTATRNYTPLNETPLVSPGGSVVFTIAPGVFTQVADAAITDINAQSLPAPLPPGWSPLSAFHFATTVEPALAVSATLTLAGPLAADVDGVFARFDENTHRWSCISIQPGTGATAQVAVMRSGTYAFVAGDPAPNAPPAPVVGGTLAGTTAPVDFGGIAATATVSPSVAAASREAARVTASARVAFTTSTPVPSGAFFPTRITETYALRPSGSTRTPDYDTTVFAYRRPTGGLAADFPLRPQLLLGPDELGEAVVKVDVLTPGDAAFGGAVLDGTGGVLNRDGIAVTIGPGALPGSQVAELAGLAPADFGGLLGGVPPAKAFDLNIGTLATPAAFAFRGLTPGQRYVLGVVVTDGTQRGVTPVERFVANASGVLTTEEPATGERLPGARGAGQYVLVPVPGPQGIVNGIARNTSGQPAAGLAVRVTGQPWLVFSKTGGTYQILAPAGPAPLTVFDVRDGNAGNFAATVVNPAQPTNADLTTAPTGPRVAGTSPAAGATNVNSVTPITVRFSEPINPASFVAGGVVLTDATAAPVPAALSLNAANTVATLLPTNPLAAGAAYSIEVSAGITDITGLPLEGPRIFAFTVAAANVRPPGAQLVIYEPGAANVPQAVLDQLVGYEPGPGSSHVIAHGSAGLADPEVAVILVNETTGETATVLSKPDGSFANFINAAVEDFVVAVFVNANGTRVSVPATRQHFDDGRVGLYSQGGILEAQSDGGPVQIFIEPKAIKERSVFKFDAIPLAQLLSLVNNTPPADGSLIGGFKLKVENEQPSGNAEISFPVAADALHLPEGEDPEDAAIGAVIPVTQDGVTTYELVDKLRFENGRAVTNTFPFAGIFLGAAVAGVVTDTILLTVFGAKPVTVHGRALESKDAIVAEFFELDTLPLVGLAGIFSSNPVFGVVELAAQAAASTGEDLPLPPNTLPIAGALVTARPTTVQPPNAGRLSAGVVYSTSGRDGRFTLILPLTIGEAGVVASSAPNYILSATHPRYGRRATAPLPNSQIGFTQVGTTPFFRQDVVFDKDSLVKRTTDEGAIQLLVGVDPVSPAVNVDARFAALATKADGIEIRAVAVSPLSASSGEATLADLTLSQGSLESFSNGIVKRRIATLRATKPMQALIETSATASDGSAPPTLRQLIVTFGGPPTTALPGEPTAANPSDRASPEIMSIEPQPPASLPVGGRIRLKFNEPLRQGSVYRAGAVTVNPAGSTPAIVRLSPDQTTIEITPGLYPANIQSIDVTIGSEIEDLSGNHFDGDPSTTNQFEAGTRKFHLAPVVTRQIAGVGSGGGVTFHGGFAYVLDRAGSGEVKVFDLTAVLTGAGQNTVGSAAFVFPRDLAMMPDWSFRRGLGKPVETKDFLAVVGGEVGVGGDTEAFSGQLLRIYDVSNPPGIANFKGATLTFRNATVNRVVWNAPELAYIEAGSDFQHIGIVDVQEMFTGLFATPEEQDEFPVDGRRGEDFDGNGDYVGPGELLPLPPRNPPEFYGKKTGFSFIEPGFIQDLDFRGLIYTGIVMTGGTGSAPSYRTLQMGGGVIGETGGRFNFDPAARPKRVTAALDQRVAIGGTPTVASIALVSLAPDADGKNKIAIIDITNPTNPLALVPGYNPRSDTPGAIPADSAIELPDALGIPQGFTRLPNGLVALSTTQNQVLIDPARLFEVKVTGTALHPAVVGVIPRAGSGNRTLVQDMTGLNLVSLGARTELAQTAPRLRFVSFPLNSALVDPKALLDQPVATAAAFKNLQEMRGLPPARFKTSAGVATSTLQPGAPRDHYHVLVDAPGAAGSTIRIALESLNPAKYQLTPRGRNYPPVRAMTEQGRQPFGQAARSDGAGPVDAVRDALTAHRLSSDKTSPFYNLYLTEPFALIIEKIRPSELAELENPKPRAVLWGGDFLAASLDPITAGNSVLGAFATRVFSADEVSRPAAVILSTQPGGDIPGLDPPPIGGNVALPFTLGSVAALNGEVRLMTADVELPSARLPIIFQRVAGTQDTRYGPFGPDWDHNYNQRLYELKAGTFPAGGRKPVVAKRGKIANAADLEFVDGEGHVIVFRRLEDGKDNPGIKNDPLLMSLNFLPDGVFYAAAPEEKGVFDVVCRRPTGEFVRITPAGLQFWYDDAGRLTSIYDRFPDNVHTLHYNDRGELKQIIDKSEKEPKFIKIGYYRRGPKLDEVLDVEAGSGFVSGRIAKLVDHVGRETIFEYTIAGMLKGVIRPTTDSRAAGFGFKGEPRESYVLQSDQGGRARGTIVGNGAHAGAGAGTPAAASQLADVPEKGLTAQDSRIAGKPPTSVTPPTGAQGGFSSTAPNQQDTKTEFDGNGFLTKSTASGPNLADVVETSFFNDLGLPETHAHPNGSVTTVLYDSGPQRPFRSRGNPLRISRTAGPKGGGDYSSTFVFDERYNQPTGQWLTPNGRTITHTLSADGREVESVAYEGGARAAFTYDAKGKLTRMIAPDGVRTEFLSFNDDGFPEETKRGDYSTLLTYGTSLAGRLGKPSQVTLPAGDPITGIAYDSRLNLLTMQRGPRAEAMAYDENGNRVLLERDVDNGLKFRERLFYDQVSFLEKMEVENVETAALGLQTLVTRYVPDDSRRVLSEILPGGETRGYTYDHTGEVRTTTIGESTFTYERDTEGNLTEVKRNNTSIRKHEMIDGHNRIGLVKMERSLLGAADQIEMTYHPGGELKSSKITNGSDGQVAAELSVSSVDAIGRPFGPQALRRTTDAGQSSYGFAYVHGADGGMVTTITGPRDTTTRTTNTAGQLTGISDSLRTITVTPNGNDFVTEIKSDEDGTPPYVTKTTPNGLDFATHVEDLEGTILDIDPRLDGQPRKLTDARGKETKTTHSVLGERLRTDKPESIRFDFGYNRNRQPKFAVDRAGKGNTHTYDPTLRRSETSLRDPAAVETVQDFSFHQLPTEILSQLSMVELDYDWQGRVISRSVEETDGNFEVSDIVRDALGRVVSADFGPAGEHSATMAFDKLGPLRSATYDIPGGPFEITAEHESDGSRKQVTYPSLRVVDETRQASRRLQTVKAANVAVWDATAFRGAELPGDVNYGPGIKETNSYDLRKRLRSRLYTRVSDGAVLGGVRYKYDAADNRLARQLLHGQGRADVFTYDDANRLKRAEYGARPGFATDGNRVAAGVTGGESLDAGFFARDFSYDGVDGLDLLGGGALQNPDAFPVASSVVLVTGPIAPAFAGTITGHDDFLLPLTVDGNSRSDTRGNVSRAQLWVRDPGTAADPRQVNADLKYDGFHQLVEVSRDDGVLIKYSYDLNGLIHLRERSGGGQPDSRRAWVWDRGRLIEEYEISGGSNVLMGRFYYADGDWPVAADLRTDTAAPLVRRFFLRDGVESVIAVGDEAGQVVERTDYEAWGQPAIEAQDTAAPSVAKVRTNPSGGISIVFTECVAPPITAGTGNNLVTQSAGLDAKFAIIDGAQQTDVSGDYGENLPGFPFGAVVVIPDAGLPSVFTLRVKAGAVVDRWGNPNAEQDIPIDTSLAPQLFTGALGEHATAPQRRARSTVGNPFLFQGQYFDYDTGLVYMRARFYEPFTGQFLQRDPEQYEDSVNLYAAFRNSPTGYRDPQGTNASRVGAVSAKVASVAEDVRAGNVDDVTARGLDMFRRGVQRVIRASQEAGDVVQLGRRQDTIAVEGEAVERLRRLQAKVDELAAQGKIRIILESAKVGESRNGFHRVVNGISEVHIGKRATDEKVLSTLVHELTHAANYQDLGRRPARGLETLFEEFDAHIVQYGLESILVRVSADAAALTRGVNLRSFGFQTILDQLASYSSKGVNPEMVTRYADLLRLHVRGLP